MTRTSSSLAVVTTLVTLLAALAGTGQATAQLGFLFGPSGKQRAYRPRRRVAPVQRRLPAAPRPAPGLQRPPTFPLYTPPVEVPLPPPRPHFPDDPPAAGVEPVPSAGAPRAPATMAPTTTEPAGPGAAKESQPPAPPSAALPKAPEKPADRPKPELPARPESAAPPAPPKSTAQPPVTVVPVPDELPPDGPGTHPPSKPIAPTPKEAAPPEKPTASPEKAPGSPVPAPGAPPATPPLPPPKPPELAKPAPPGVAPSGARLGETPRQPEDDAACLDRLKSRNVTAESTTIGPQKDERCTVVRPVRLLGLALADGGKVEFPEHPTIACTTAETFSTYVRDLLAPLAKGSFGSPVSAVWTGPGLECRSRDSIVGAKLSAHGQGLAIDVAQLKLADGRKIEVGDPKGDAGQAFESAARAGACGYFHTVLGPGSDSYHRTHWHFDLIVRGAQGDSKYCK